MQRRTSYRHPPVACVDGRMAHHCGVQRAISSLASGVTSSASVSMGPRSAGAKGGKPRNVRRPSKHAHRRELEKLARLYGSAADRSCLFVRHDGGALKAARWTRSLRRLATSTRHHTAGTGLWHMRFAPRLRDGSWPCGVQFR